MNKLLLSVLCLLVAFAVVAPCLADTVNGVLAEDRVISLPQDQGKWYVSVVGGATDANYQKVLNWFEVNASLKRLKDRVHFCPVVAGTPIYHTRYAANVKGLPTVRVQWPDGTVVYEAAGRSLPMTADGLYGAMAGAADKAQGIRPVLPWRRNMERRCRPNPNPQPQPQPDLDPEPQPIDDGGAPVFYEQAANALSSAIVVCLAVACALAGIAAGFVVQWRKTYAGK